MFKAALYLAFGIVFHAVFVGAQFDPSNLWSWFWLLCWPVPAFIVVVFIGSVVLAINFWIGFIKGAFR